MRTAEGRVVWRIFLQGEDFSTSFTDSSSCSILSKASLLSSGRVLVKLQLLKKKPTDVAPGSDSTDFPMQIHISH